MTCEQTRELLLTAELEELEGLQPGPMAAHLGTCASCRTAAERILAATRGLAAERSQAPWRPAAVVAARAREESARVRRVRQQRIRWGLAPLLAAAGIGAVLLLRPGLPDGNPIAARAERVPPLVESAARNVAVFTTDNPTIVVVWQF